MRNGFVRIAAAVPEVRVADTNYNLTQILSSMEKAAHSKADILLLPYLCITGATCGDLFFQNTLLSGAEEGLSTILAATRNLDMVTVVGMPVQDELSGALYNCAVLLHKGSVLGVVPKTHLTRAQRRYFSPN